MDAGDERCAATKTGADNNSNLVASPASSAKGMMPSSAPPTGRVALDTDTSVNSSSSSAPNKAMDPPGQQPSSSQTQSSPFFTAPPPSTAASSNDSGMASNSTSSTSTPGACRVTRTQLKAAPLTAALGAAGGGGAVPMTPGVQRINEQARDNGGSTQETYLVIIPPNIFPGMAYESEKGGWKRTIRTTDLKFHWFQPDQVGGGERDLDQHFDFLKSAFVRKLTFMEGNDTRMRTGTVELVPASEATVDSRLVVQNRTLLSYTDISQMQGKTLEEKREWFEGICEQLTTPREDGHVEICVRRSHLLLDSMEAVMALSREDMRKPWRVEFLGEEALLCGGLMREWFELVSKELFDPANGLWIQTTSKHQYCVDINPGSGKFLH